MQELGVADIHTHTMYSGFSKYSYITFPDCMTTPWKSVKAARRLGLDVLCITDHDTIKGGLKAQKYDKQLVVVGEEISSGGGEIIGLFLQEPVKPGLSAEETIEHIHEQDGIAVAPHPFSEYCPSVGQRMHTLQLDGVEVFNALHRNGYANALSQERCNGFAKLGGSDAHASYMIGNGYTLFNGSSQDDLRAAIKGGKTSYGGKVASLGDFVRYSVRIALESSKLILKLNNIRCPLSSSVSGMRNSRKMLCLLGSFIYAFTPLSIAAALIGDRMAKNRGRRIRRGLDSQSVSGLPEQDKNEKI